MAAHDELVLEIQDLRISYADEKGVAVAVSDVDLSLRAGAVTALVGASGSGKSTVALAIMQLLPRSADIEAGAIRLYGLPGKSAAVDLLTASKRTMRAVRGGQIAMIFQSPGAALDPLRSIGAQIEETLWLHRRMDRSERAREMAQLLAEVELAPNVARAYAHELSGGMQQRAMIAMALAGEPRLLLADEPTSALDVAVQSQVLALLARLQRSRGMSVLLITHDIAVAAQVADEICCIDAGSIVEHGAARIVIAAPQHAATRALVQDARTLAATLDAQ